jgi:cell division protein FtsB
MNRYLLLLLLIPLGVIYFKPPYAEQQEAQRRLEELTLQRDATKEKAARLKRKLDLIRNDDEYLEAMARDRLHLQKDGEIIVRFDR